MSAYPPHLPQSRAAGTVTGMSQSTAPASPSVALDPLASATVFASAGTGKTWLLVSRLLRLLLTGVEPGSILAITFTNKAAGEMQERLLARLHTWASADDGGLDQHLGEIGCTPDAALRTRARTLYEALLWAPYPPRISTFHAFCQDLLSRFPLEAGAPPGFELLETIEEPREAALDALYGEAGNRPDDALAQALSLLFDTCGGLDGAAKSLRNFLNHRADWWAFTEHQGDPLGTACARLAAQLAVDPARDLAADYLGEAKRADFSDHADLLCHPKNTATLHQRGTDLRAALAQNGTPATLFKRIAETLLTKTQTLRSDPRASPTLDKRLGSVVAAQLVGAHQHLGAEVLAVLEVQRRQHAFAVNRAWYIAGTRFVALFQDLKRQRRQLDFADLEWLAYRLLNDAEHGHWIQFKLDQRIEHVLIDEFQDTNPTQWRLLQPLLQAFTQDPERPRSVLLVGDAKQSIYSFRRANPELQGTAADWLERTLASHRVALDRSWRSAPGVIDLVNQVFTDPEMPHPIAGFTPHATHRDALWGRIEFLPLARSGDEGESSDPPAELRDPLTTARPRKPNAYQVEGRQLAERIRDLVDAGWCVGEAAQTRPLRYGDIQILLRKRTHVADYEAALRAAGIPVRGSARGRLLSRLEIGDLRALLGVLATPDDNHALAQVLRAPLFAASDDDLLRLAEAAGTGSWYAALPQASADAPPTAPLRRAAEHLPAWRAQASTLPLHDLLDHIYFDGDVLQRYAAAARPWQRAQTLANLRRLLELALSLDSGRYPSLERFLERIAVLAESDDDSPNEPLPEYAETPVEILTIHGAKGLEAPVVFYVDLGPDRDNDHPYAAMVDWPAQAPRPEAFLLQLKKELRDGFSLAVRSRWQQIQAREDANLLYVALTRARQMLVLSGATTGRGNPEHSTYAQLRRRCEGATTEIDLDAPWHCQQGEIPIAKSPPAPAHNRPAAVPLPLDELRQPLPIRDRRAEILPSTIEPQPVSRRDTPSDPDVRIRGQAIHAFLDHCARHPSDAAAPLQRRIANALGIDQHDPRLDAWLAEARAVIAGFPHWFAPHTSAYNEIPITYRVDNRTVHGVIDRLVVEPTRLVLIDYKTQPHLDAATRSQLAERYREQLRLYAEGLRRLWPERPLHAGLLFTHGAQWYPVET